MMIGTETFRLFPISPLMLTTEALVAEIPEEQKRAPAGGGHGGGMEGMY